MAEPRAREFTSYSVDRRLASAAEMPALESQAQLLFTRHVRSSGRTTNQASVELRTMLGYGLPLYAAGIFSVFLTQYQNIVLPHFASNVEVGNFGATWNFGTFMAILSYPVTTVMFPMFSKMDPKDQRSDLARGFMLAVKYSSLVMIPASVAVMVLSRNLIYLTFGSGYNEERQMPRERDRTCRFSF